MSINRVSITGNLTRDPELRMTANGTAVMNLGVAVNDRRKNGQTGEWEDQPNFIDCVIFGQRADSLSRILAKGMKVAIDGKLRQNRWQDRQTGQNRSKVEVVVDDLDFMSRGQDGQGGNQRQQPARKQDYQNQQPAPYPSYQSPQRAVPAPTAQPARQAMPAQTAQAPAQPQFAVQGEPESVYDPNIPF